LLETLRKLGAEVDFISVYKRICPSNFDDKVRADIITITSLLSLSNLLQMLPYDWLYEVSMNVTGLYVHEKAITLIKESIRENELVCEKFVSLISEAWLEYTLAVVSEKKGRVCEVGFKRALEMSMRNRPLWSNNPFWVIDLESDADPSFINSHFRFC